MAYRRVPQDQVPGVIAAGIIGVLILIFAQFFKVIERTQALQGSIFISFIFVFFCLLTLLLFFVSAFYLAPLANGVKESPHAPVQLNTTQFGMLCATILRSLYVMYACLLSVLGAMIFFRHRKEGGDVIVLSIGKAALDTRQVGISLILLSFIIVTFLVSKHPVFDWEKRVLPSRLSVSDSRDNDNKRAEH
jgi:hypothetical protein